MPVIRIFLLLIVLAGLTLLLVQNWLPVLPLVFLGIRTQALPLAVWILMSVVAGAFTSVLLAGLFKLSNYFAIGRQLKTRRNVEAAQKRSNTQRNEAPKTTVRSQSDTSSTTRDASDDWDDGTADEDDWDFEESAPPKPSSSPNNVKDTNYEVSNEPYSSYRSGVYSYNYREPKDTGVGKTESVYDADYRVIAQPYQKTNKDEKEDWGFDDNDDIDDEEPSNSRKR